MLAKNPVAIFLMTASRWRTTACPLLNMALSPRVELAGEIGVDAHEL